MRLGLLVATLFAFVGTGCVWGQTARDYESYCLREPTAAQCQSEIPSSVRFYAGFSDYLRVKRAAALYAEAPGTPVSHVTIILTVVEEADEAAARVNAARKNGSITPETYEVGLAILRKAIFYLTTEISKREADTGIQPPVTGQAVNLEDLAESLREADTLIPSSEEP